MLYANFVKTKLVLQDQPRIKYDLAQENIFKRVLAQLLICDGLPDNNFAEVLDEAAQTLEMQNPSFEVLFNNEFEEFVESRAHLGKWQKIRQDYGYFISKEIKRRNKENPYRPGLLNNLDAWEKLPDFSRVKVRRPWLFDHLNRDAQILCAEAANLFRNWREAEDKDFFRVKVNSILVPEKIIFALNSAEYVHGYSDIEATIADLKLNLDGYKLADIFLNRFIESLHKIGWSAEPPRKQEIDKTIHLADGLHDKLKQRIEENEKRLILYLDLALNAEE